MSLPTPEEVVQSVQAQAEFEKTFEYYQTQYESNKKVLAAYMKRGATSMILTGKQEKLAGLKLAEELQALGWTAWVEHSVGQYYRIYWQTPKPKSDKPWWRFW